MLDKPLDKLIKTTPKHLKRLEELGMTNGFHLLCFFPRKIEEAVISTNLSTVKLGEKATLHGTIYDIRKQNTKHGKVIFTARLLLLNQDSLEVIWFRQPYQLRTLSEGSQVYLIGVLKKNYYGQVQLQSPEIHEHQGVHVGGIRPVYPESPPLTSKWWREKIAGLMPLASGFPEILPQDLLEATKLMPLQQAIKQIHFPESVKHWQAAKTTLAFTEILGIQLRVMQAKIWREQIQKNPFEIHVDYEKVKQDLAELPFELTLAQKTVLFEVFEDLKKSRPMNRMVQGDVGNGKTIVGFLASLPVLRSGYQTAIMAPTEILAKQHFANALKFYPAGTQVELLTGSVTAKKKENIKDRLANGEIAVVVGTHALLTDDTVFKNLGLAVIDEQHRFGVRQRAVLQKNHTHTLNMTATPIPRSLALTIYGDQDLSIINEKPNGRKDIITRVIADEKTETMCWRFMADQVEKGQQVFWVCPLVEASEKLESKSVEEQLVYVQQLFPDLRVEPLHGKMKAREKDAIMKRFKDHEFDILVSTSVIEVGVDIPRATVMVIENAERFGLSQLHQFRGRIGRNDKQCYCFMRVTDKSDKHKERLKAMVKSNDGFYLSEVDLSLRGAGEMYGTKQSGLPDLKMADLSDANTMKLGRDWAEKLLKDDLALHKYPLLQKLVQSKEVFF